MFMRKQKLLILIALFSLIVSPAQAELSVTSIIDGDTIKLNNGTTIRLLQIDTPELRSNECYATEAQKLLAKLLNRSGKVTLTTDPSLDEKDKYGRLLRYLFIGKKNINLEMIRLGAAAPYFYRKERGMYAEQMLKAAESAKLNQLGFWSKCPGTKLNPNYALSTFSQNRKASTGECDPNYAGCVPLFPPDLDCSDLKAMGKTPVRVIGTDVHKLDADGDGIGCL
jgi:endonuclease YncB( thermonuclease family)